MTESMIPPERVLLVGCIRAAEARQAENDGHWYTLMEIVFPDGLKHGVSPVTTLVLVAPDPSAASRFEPGAEPKMRWFRYITWLIATGHPHPGPLPDEIDPEQFAHNMARALVGEVAIVRVEGIVAKAARDREPEIHLTHFPIPKRDFTQAANYAAFEAALADGSLMAEEQTP